MVGSAVCRALSDAGYTHIVTRTHKELDLTIQKDVLDFFADEKPDAVILAAAKVGGILANNTYRADFIYQNLAIATNVIHAAWTHSVRKLINLGSSCIYPRVAPQPLTESSLLTGPLEPTNEPYAVAKIAAIKLCRSFNEQYGTNYISAMPTNLYGPGDNFDPETSHVLPALIRKLSDAARDNGAVTLWGDGTPMREFLYVDDLAEALVFLLEHVDADTMREVSPDYFVNVGTGVDCTIGELAETIARTVGYSGKISWDTTKPNGTPRKLMDVSAMTRLGWTASTPLEDGIRRTWEWYRSSS